MDLITLALARKYTDKQIIEVAEGVVPSIGENGNWYINGIDTGVHAAANVEVDGILKVDIEKQQLIVEKDGEQIVVGKVNDDIYIEEFTGNL